MDSVVSYIQAWDGEVTQGAQPQQGGLPAVGAPPGMPGMTAVGIHTPPVLQGAQSPSGPCPIGQPTLMEPQAPEQDPWDPWRRAATAQRQAPMNFQGPSAREDLHSKFSEKVAIMATYQYDGEKGGAQWRRMIKQYLISRAPEMERLLQDVESREDSSATTVNLASRVPTVCPSLAQKLSRDL